METRNSFGRPECRSFYGGLLRLTGVDPLTFVRPVNCVAYLLSMAALLLLGRAAKMRWWVTAMMMAVIGWNGHYLSMHNKMWSEPAMVALLVMMLWCGVAALRQPQRAARFVAAACALAAAAMMLRYAAVAVVPVLIVVALLARRPRLAVLPLLARVPVLVALTILNASSGNRSVAVHRIPWSENAMTALTLGDQIVPQRLAGGAIAVAVMLLWIGAGSVLAYRYRAQPTSRALTVALLWCGAYAAFLPFAQLFISPPFRIDLRILTPLYVGLVVVAAATVGLALETSRHALAFLLALPLVIATSRAGRFMITSASTPPADAQCVGRQWYVDTIRRAPPPGTVATNAQGTVWLALRRPVQSTGPADAYIWIDARVGCDNVVEDGTMPPPPATGSNGLVVGVRR